MAGSVVAIGKDRILTVNEKPFFPIGARHIPAGATLTLLKQVGFNSFRWTAFGTDTAQISTAQLPSDLGGLMFYPYVFNKADILADIESRRKQLTDMIQTVREHPALLCYEQRNEPAYTAMIDHARPQSPPEGLISGSRVIRELDPNHPIRIGHSNCNLVSTLRKYNAAVDIVGCNPYVVSPPRIRRIVGMRSDGLVVDSPNQTLSAVGDHTTKMMRVAEGRPVWMQLQGSANENFYNEAHTPENRGQGPYEHLRLYPSRWEMRFMAFHAIIRGATAMEWFLPGVPVGSGPWGDVCRGVGEWNSLQEVLCAPVGPSRMETEYREMGFSDWTGVENLVKLHHGRPWILAANSQFDPMEPTFSNLPENLGDVLEVFGEDREVPINSGSFSDRFQPYEVHVYLPRS